MFVDKGERRVENLRTNFIYAEEAGPQGPDRAIKVCIAYSACRQNILKRSKCLPTY